MSLLDFISFLVTLGADGGFAKRSRNAFQCNEMLVFLGHDFIKLKSCHKKTSMLLSIFEMVSTTARKIPLAPLK